MIVYMAKNKINNKCYIGITAGKLKYRKRAHEKMTNHSNRKFHNALKKYGFDNFDWIVLEHCNSYSELEDMEKYYIKEYDSMNNGYNLTSGGEIMKEYSDESKKKMREIRLEWHTKNKNGFKGRSHTDEGKKLISESAIGRPSPNKNKSLSKTHKENLSKAQTEWLENNEHPNLGRTWKHRSKREHIEVICPNCGKIGKGPNMTRYHFDKCRINREKGFTETDEAKRVSISKGSCSV
jgi:group I intron endonuclease